MALKLSTEYTLAHTITKNNTKVKIYSLPQSRILQRAKLVKNGKKVELDDTIKHLFNSC